MLSEKGALRWWSNVKGDVANIDKWRPPVGSCVKDQGNGRFLIACLGRQRVSYSCTVRGVEAASVQVLKQLWQWHSEATWGAVPIASLREDTAVGYAWQHATGQQLG